MKKSVSVIMFLILIVCLLAGCSSDNPKEGKIYLPKGGVYTGEIVGGQPNGYGTLELRTGEKFIGEWVNGTPIGPGIIVFTDGTRIVCEYKDGEFIYY